MPAIDDRGRLFGKVNLIDATVGLILLLLIPLGYGAYLIFRTPAPQIIAVEPATLIEGTDLRVQLRGENLRAFLRASIGTEEAKGFLVQSLTLAEVKLPSLKPGTYDLILYDQVQEVARRPAALTIVAPPPPPSTMVQVLGVFAGLDPQGARALTVGARFPHGASTPMAEVLALKPPEPAVEQLKGTSGIVAIPVPGKVQVPALLRLRCTLARGECKAGDIVGAPGATLSLPGSTGLTSFFVEEVRPADAPLVFPERVWTTIQVLGTFTSLDPEGARALTVGARFPRGASTPMAEVLALKPPEVALQRLKTGNVTVATPVPGRVQVPAFLRLRCVQVREGCKVGDTLVAPEATLVLLGPKGDVSFFVEQVRAADAPAVFPVPVPAEVVVSGTFQGVEKEMAETLRRGRKLAGPSKDLWAEIVHIESGPTTSWSIPPESPGTPPVPVRILDRQVLLIRGVLRVPCLLQEQKCWYGGTQIKPAALLTFGGDKAPVSFHVQKVLDRVPREASLELLVRFLVHRETSAVIKVGDADQAGLAAEPEVLAVVTAIKETRELPGRTRIEFGQGVTEFDQPLISVDAVLRVSAEETSDGWQYKGKPLKVGGVFTFEAPLYTMRGEIRQITLPR